MRPTAKTQSALRSPLNNLLGTESNVRILRILTESETLINTAELARRAELNPRGVPGAVNRLCQLGIVERVGGGRSSQLRLRSSHRLSGPIKELFDAERKGFEALLADVRSAVVGLSAPPRSAWIQGTVAVGRDTPDDSILATVMAGSRELTSLMEELRRSFSELQREYDVSIELRGITQADVDALAPHDQHELDHVIMLVGPPPNSYLQRADHHPKSREAKPRDDVLLALAAAIAEKLERDPTFVRDASNYITQRLKNASSGEAKELREWATLLESMSVPRLQKFLVDGGPRATRLRQTLPFVDVLSPAERQAIMEQAGP